MKRLSWKYIAGLIDGEGCIDFQCHVDQRDKEPRLYIVPRLRIAMTIVGKDVLELLKVNHGGNIWECKRNHHNPNWQPALYWQLQGKQQRLIWVAVRRRKTRYFRHRWIWPARYPYLKPRYADLPS